MDKSIETKTREDIYKIVIAVEELAKTKTGALIVIQRDISLSDIVSTGIEMNSEISPQLLVNIFVPKTPLHDGAVVINNNRIAAAACILPLANNTDISKELFNNDYLIKILDEHKNREKDNYRKIWAVYSFLKWYDEYFVKR